MNTTNCTSINGGTVKRLKKCLKKQLHEALQCSHQRYAPTAERKTTLNYKSEPCGGLGKLPEAGSLPLTVHMAGVLQNNGRNHIPPPPPPAVWVSQTNRKTTITQAGPPSCGSGAIGPVKLREIQLFLPAATGLWVIVRRRDTEVSQLYLPHQPLGNASPQTLFGYLA